jgi:hypothetical protein
LPRTSVLKTTKVDEDDQAESVSLAESAALERGWFSLAESAALERGGHTVFAAGDGVAQGADRRRDVCAGTGGEERDVRR